MTTTTNAPAATAPVSTAPKGPSIMKPAAAAPTPAKAATPAAPATPKAAAPAPVTPPAPTPSKAAPGPITPTKAVNDTRRKEFDATITKLGQQDGAGASARPAMAFAAMSAAREGVITPDDTAAVYSRYKKAAGKAGADGVADMDEKSIKQQTSKLKQIIKCGAIKKFDTVPMMERALDTVKTLASAGTISKKRNVYEDMVQIARTQLGSADAALTDEQVTEAFLPTEKERTFLKEVGKLVDRMSKLHEGGEGMEDIEGLDSAKDDRFVSAMDALADLKRELEKKAAVAKYLADAAALGINLKVA